MNGGSRWRPLALAGGAFLLWLAGFLMARRRPPEPVPLVIASSNEATKAATQAHVATQAAETKTRAQVKRRHVRIAVAPDGTKTQEVTEELATDTRQAAQLAAQSTHATSLEATRQTVTTVFSRRSWTFGAMGGVNAGAVIGRDRRWWLGAEATHAFVGPFRWGLVTTVNSEGSVNLGAVLEVER